MKSISLHNVEKALEQRIRQQAKKQGLSLNKTIQLLLKKSLGLVESEVRDHRHQFLDLFGVWTEEDSREFERATQSFEALHEEDWQ